MEHKLSHLPTIVQKHTMITLFLRILIIVTSNLKETYLPRVTKSMLKMETTRSKSIFSSNPSSLKKIGIFQIRKVNLIRWI